MVKSENPIFCEDVLKKFMIQDPILSPPPSSTPLKSNVMVIFYVILTVKLFIFSSRNFVWKPGMFYR